MDFADGIEATVQPSTVREPYLFFFPFHTSPDANDGNLPYGFVPTAMTICVTDTKHTPVAGEVSSVLIYGTPPFVISATGVTVPIELSWPGSRGTFWLEFRFSDGVRTLPRDFRAVVCRER